MDSSTVSRIEDWETRPFSGGYAALRDLSEGEFSGVVAAAGAWLFMLNGRVVGVFDGSVESFDGADGTAYEAPDPGLVLLLSMREQGGETQGQYYTDDTPLSEVDDMLSEAGFTGYVELSENVLSGDYYVAYYGGRSMSVAFIGNAGRVLTGDEAFERASDEVGIYEVVSVDLEVRDIPEPEASAAREAPSADTPDEDATEPSPEPAEPDDAPEPEPTRAPDADAAPEDDTPADPEGGEKPETSAGEPTSDAGSAEDDRPDAEPGAGEAPTDADAEPGNGPARGETGEHAVDAEPGDHPEEAGEDPFSEEAAWRETRTVPALDPDQTEAEAASDAPSESDTPAAGEEAGTQPDEPPGNDADADLAGRIERLEAELDDRESTVAELRERLEEITAERDALEEERDRLRRRIEELEAGASAAGSAGGTELDPESALDQTDVFVRYDSKGKATLEDAHDGDSDKEAVNANLRLEEHTRFDADDVVVSGRPFEAFLEDRMEYRFVRWLVEDLLYEIQDTGSKRALQDLYDALPRIDRIEFAGRITTRDEEGEERSETFDVVCRDRMGQALIVADLNDARDPATGDMMSGLIEGATAVGDAHDELGAAFFVTASFFEPDALETASEATGGGFLDRDARKSFVKLARKRGYHLCLVEARRGKFHVAVPDL